MGKSSLSRTNLSSTEMSRKSNKFKTNISNSKQLINKKKIRRLKKQKLQNFISKLQNSSKNVNVEVNKSVNESDVTLTEDQESQNTVIEISDCIDEGTETQKMTEDKSLVKKIDNVDGWSEYETCNNEDTVDSPNNIKLSSINKSVKRLKTHQLDNFTEDIILVDEKPHTHVLASSTPLKGRNIDSTLPCSYSFHTIDLTGEVDNERSVINVDSDSEECTVVSESGFSMSRDSEVTVLNTRNRPKSRVQKRIEDGISKLKTPAKKKLLRIIANNLFNGCELRNNFSRTRLERSLDSIEGRNINIGFGNASVNSFGSNIYNPMKEKKAGLRMIVIDGSNVAVEHGRGTRFSVQGLKICIDYFLKRGHMVKAFVPRFRCKAGKSTDPKLLDSLEREGYVVYTPSREVQGRLITSYDDRYIIQCAAEFDGVIVSGDNYRDLLNENPKWKFVIENRLLPFTWVNNMIMFPRDPLGRNGPTLEVFLKHT